MVLLGDFGPPHYCTSICVRSCCTGRASYVDLINKKKQKKSITQFQGLFLFCHCKLPGYCLRTIIQPLTETERLLVFSYRVCIYFTYILYVFHIYFTYFSKYTYSYVYRYVHIYIYIYLYVCIYTYIYLYIYIYIHIYTYIYIFIYIYVCVCVCVCVYVCVCVCVCV